jgi:hypothetical protein
MGVPVFFGNRRRQAMRAISIPVSISLRIMKPTATKIRRSFSLFFENSIYCSIVKYPVFLSLTSAARSEE